MAATAAIIRPLMVVAALVVAAAAGETEKAYRALANIMLNIIEGPAHWALPHFPIRPQFSA
jgi:hypothetical protein